MSLASGTSCCSQLVLVVRNTERMKSSTSQCGHALTHWRQGVSTLGHGLTRRFSSGLHVERETETAGGNHLRPILDIFVSVCVNV